MITSDGCVVVPAGAVRAVKGAAGAATVMKVDGLETGDLLAAFEQVAPQARVLRCISITTVRRRFMSSLGSSSLRLDRN